MASSRDQTYTKDMEKIYNLVNDVKSLDVEFQQGIDNKKGDEQIDTDDKLITYQSEFWEAYVKRIESFNDTNVNGDEYSAWENSNKCCQMIWNFYTMVKLYNQDIYGNGLMTDLNSRKLTILIAISDLKQFRCGGNSTPIVTDDQIEPNKTDDSNDDGDNEKEDEEGAKDENA